eukprot:scaffold1944_cov241-Pinguiococcus_pyrenoidosus.AAC.27
MGPLDGRRGASEKLRITLSRTNSVISRVNARKIQTAQEPFLSDDVRISLSGFTTLVVCKSARPPDVGRLTGLAKRVNFRSLDLDPSGLLPGSVAWV